MTDSITQANRFQNRLITEASPYLLQHAEDLVEVEEESRMGR